MTASSHPRGGGERGFTLVELLVVMALTSVLLTLGVVSLQHYWRVRSLRSAADVVEAAFRSQHQQAEARSLPNVFGVWFEPGTSRWGRVQYDMSTSTCTVTQRDRLSGGVRIDAASFAAVTTPPMTASCITAVAAPTAKIAFFFARGSATPGSVTFAHPAAPAARKPTVTVSANTGRADQS